jgi:hypothetical protein
MLIIAALLSLLEILSLPSSGDKVWLFGLSVQRLVIALLPFFSLLFFIALVVMMLFASNVYQRIITHLQPSSQIAIFTGYFCFWAALFLGGTLIYYRMTIAPNVISLTPQLGIQFPTLCAYLDRLWAILMFITFCMASWTIYIFFILKLPLFRNISELIGIGSGVLCISATIFQWVVFFFKLHIFEQIPGWYWPIIPKPDFARHGILFALALLFFILILYLVKRFPRSHIFTLVLISLVFIGIQFSIGYLEGRGLASLTDRFFLSYHRIYIEEACNAKFSSHEAIIHYEDLFPSMFLQTKPPGVLWMSFKLNQIANLPVLSATLDWFSKTLTLSEYLPRMVSTSCQRAMSLTTIIFPILATSTIWVMYGFSKWVIGGKDYGQLAFYSASLFVLAPNIVMLVLFLDQTFYPPLFLLVAGGILISMRKESFVACFIIGVALYAVIFLSFSMLPLLIIPIIYFACLRWQEKKTSTIWLHFKKTLLPMGLGGLFSMSLFKIFLNYDIFTRFQRMMTTRIEGDFYTRLGLQSTGEATFLEKMIQTWNAAKLNNIELAVAIGFPVFIFFIIMGLRSMLHVIQRKPDVPTATINTSLFLAYIALNALRVVLGEAGRLWMFWVPVMSILAIQYLMPLIKRNRLVIFLLIFMQIMTLFLSYQFQDYLMPQLLP